jgi:DNA polymerase sigma
MISFLHQLGHDLVQFDKSTSPMITESDTRLNIIHELNSILSTTSCLSNSAFTLETMGSFATQLYFPHSDLDLSIVFTHQIEWTKNQMSSKLSKIARKLRPIASKLTIISRARVPIIKFIHATSQLEIDLSIQQTSATESVQDILTFSKSHPNFKPLIMFLKMLLANHDLNKPYDGGIGGYSLVLWMKYFILLHPQLYPEHHQSTLALDCAQLGSLLLDFLHFFSTEFDYRHLKFNQNGQIDLKIFKHARQKKPFLLSIIDPNNPENDVAACSHQIQKVSRLFLHTYERLMQSQSSKRNLLSLVVFVDPLFYRIRSKSDPALQSKKRNRLDEDDEPSCSLKKKKKFKMKRNANYHP